MKAAMSLGIAMLAAYVYFAPAMGLRSSVRKARIAVAVLLLFFVVLSILLLYEPTLPGPNDWIEPVVKPISHLFGLE